MRPTVTDLQTLVIRWSESRSPSYYWLVRGLRPDGSFYGEVRSTFDRSRDSDGAAGVGRTVTGQLGSAEMHRVVELADSIRRNPRPDIADSVVGLLADGPIGSPTILFRCGTDSELIPQLDAFLAIIEIMRPSFAAIYPQLQ